MLAHHKHLGGIGRTGIKQGLDLVRPVASGAVRGEVDRPPPVRGSVHSNTLAVPTRSYASSSRHGVPGGAGKGVRVSCIRCTGFASLLTSGGRGAEGRGESARTSSMGATTSAWCSGGIPHHLGKGGLRRFFLSSVGPFRPREALPRGARRVGRQVTGRSTWRGLGGADRTARQSPALLWRHPGGTGARAWPAFGGPQRPRVLVQQSVDGRCAPYCHNRARRWPRAHRTREARGHPRGARCGHA